MIELQEYFSKIVNKTLRESYIYRTSYINLDLFKFWEIIKEDKVFKRYALQISVRSELETVYKSVNGNLNFTENTKKIGIEIINKYKLTNKININLLNIYIKNISKLTFLLGFYLNFYLYYGNKKTTQYYQNLKEVLSKNQDDYILNINKKEC